jgi:hypothetical protein
MFNRWNLVLGAVAGVLAAIALAVVVVVAWPGVTPAQPARPTAIVLPTDSPTPLPVVTATPTTGGVAEPSTSIAPFGDQ